MHYKKVNLKKPVRFLTIFFVVFGLLLYTFLNVFNWWGIQIARAAAPTVVGVGTVANGPGAITPGMPSGVLTDDVLLLFLETADQVITISGGTETWTEITGSPVTGATGTRLTAFWARASQDAPTSPTTSDSGDHQLARMIAFRGVVGTGNPWDVVTTTTDNTSNTSVSFPSVTTTVSDTLVVMAIAGDGPDGNSTANLSSFTNANLASLTEQVDNRVNSGDGGLLGAATGTKATAGAIGATTATLANAAVKAMMTIALKPNTPPSLSISQPDGTSDTIAQDASYNVTYTLSDTDNVVTAAFYYDTNNTGLDGTAISGACATAAEGTGATCSWNTTGVTPGSYYVYGITNDGVNPQVSAYSSGQITINARPTISVSQPDGTSDTIAQDASYNVTYTLSDTDNVVTAAFYYDTNNTGLDGTAISGACATAAEGTGATCSWNTTGVTPGSYYVYGITNDGVNPQVSAYSSGQITINARPTISVSQPDGVSDTVNQGDSYNITYSLSDSDDVSTAAFYFDTNNSGLDGTAISGACATAAEGTNVTCSWDTSGASPGTYYVYGIANDGVNSVSAYSSGQITINAPPTPNITVSTTGTQTSSMTVPSTDQSVGGAFTFQRSSGSANVTQIIITETGTVNAQTNLSNLKLYYETAATCSFEGTETAFNSTGVSFNSSAKATATGTMSVGTSQICVYATLNVGSGASDAQTLEIEISNPSTEVTASAGTVSPSTAVAIAGTTTLNVPNEAPTLSISQPDGTSDTIAQDGSYNITYTLSDTDNVVTAAFYRDTNNSGLDGTAITGACATAAEGSGVTCSWDTTGITPGSYYVYGITNDGTNPQVSAYSSGQITINARPTLTVTQPDGVSDTVTQGDSYNITYNLSDTDNVVTVAMYYDTNNTGLDGTAITGSCASAAEGTGVACSWGTSSVSPGSYYVYGITNDGVNSQVSDYSSGQITISAPINSPPVLTISQPDGASDTVTVGDLYNVTYSLSDTDNVVTASFYYDTNNSGLDGNAISGACATAAEGSNVTCSWNTAGVATGSYYVYGITNDGTNPQVSEYSSGQITINPIPVLTVSTTGTQTSSMTVPSTDQSVGGAFTFQRSSGSANVTQIIITETGTVNAQTNLSNLKLYYETAATCSFEGTETAFNSTGVSFNSSAKATATGTMSVGTSQICVYATLNVGSGASDAQTLEIEISNPSTEVTASAGTVSPSTAVAIAGTTTLNEIPVVTVSSVTPSTGAIGGNTSVTISGSNFQSGATVTFDGSAATNVVFVSGNTITAKTPAHAVGTIDVTVTNPDLTSGTLFNGFTYVGAPTVNLTASPTTVFDGESFIMNWTSTDADSCNASGSWSGSKAVSGNEAITPTASASYTLSCTGAGGSGSDSVSILVLPRQVISGASGLLFRFDGYGFSNGKVYIYDNGSLFSQLPSDADGKFSTIFRISSALEKHLFSVIAYGKDGNASPSKTFPSELYSRGGLTNILIAPSISLDKRSLNKREKLQVSGYATPNNKVKIEIDNKQVIEVTASKTGYYFSLISMSDLVEGSHQARVLQSSSSQTSDYSLLKIFRVAELFSVNSDLNSDGKLNISDWSIFLSSWSSRNESLRKKIDLNGDGKISILDLSLFLSSFSRR